MSNTYNPDEVNTDEEMAHHLWNTNCSVCSKIANRLIQLSTVAQLVDKEVNQVLSRATDDCKKLTLNIDEEDSYDLGWRQGVDRCIMHIQNLKRT